VLLITPEEFEDLVAQGLDSVPSELMNMLDNVVVLVEPETPPGERTLLGLYEGVPLTSRGANQGGMEPDRITIFRGPILRQCDAHEEVVEEVRVTVIHELAHHFGIDDDRLDELGWG
jgi:predicted Zn-dependent protease with MMP-like domain